MKSFFLIIPTRERKSHLLNLLRDFNFFGDYISQCVIVDQSEEFVGDNFKYDDYVFNISILKGDKSKGVNHSRNLAVSKYQEEDWLFFLDDDLRVEPKELDRLIWYLNNYTYDVVVPGINETRLKSDKKLNYSTILDSLCKPQSYERITNRISISSGLSVVSKDYFKKIGASFDEMFTFWGDDWDLGIRLYKVGATIKYIPEINFTHLQLGTGGQRDFKKKYDIETDKHFLQYYLLKKHFGVSVLKQTAFFDILNSVRQLQFRKALMFYRLNKKLIL